MPNLFIMIIPESPSAKTTPHFPCILNQTLIPAYTCVKRIRLTGVLCLFERPEGSKPLKFQCNTICLSPSKLHANPSLKANWRDAGPKNLTSSSRRNSNVAPCPTMVARHPTPTCHLLDADSPDQALRQAAVFGAGPLGGEVSGAGGVEDGGSAFQAATGAGLTGHVRLI